jgi:group I intron endonuclease
MTIGIYVITNKTNGKWYVGQSVNCEKRRKCYFQYNQRTQAIHKAIDKYGIDNFTFEIVEKCDKKDLNRLERHWIKTLDCIAPKGYNMTTGGDFFKHSDAARQNMSKANKGRRKAQHEKDAIRRGVLASEVAVENYTQNFAIGRQPKKWIVVMQDGSELTFTGYEEGAAHFGVTKSKFGNWARGTVKSYTKYNIAEVRCES